MISSNSITLIQINLEDYKFMQAELERLTAENSKLKEERDQARSEAFQAQRQSWRGTNYA
jgi:FtsZ-binding cell division protein ZapB